MNLRHLPLVLASLLVLGLAGCSSTPEDPITARGGDLAPEPVLPPNADAAEVPEQQLLDPNRVLARVNDEIITVRTINAFSPDLFRTLGEASEAQVKWLLDQRTRGIIRERIFLQAAEALDVKVSKEELAREIKKQEDAAMKERGVTIDEDLAARGVPRWQWESELKRALVTEKLTKMFMGRAAPTSPETRQTVDMWVSPKSVREVYDRNPEFFRQPELAQVEGIFFRASQFGERAEEEAAKAVARIRGGEDFDQVMLEVQEGPIAAYADPFGRGKNPDFVDAFAFGEGVSPGDVSDPIKVRESGYLVLKLLKYQPDRVVPFEEAEPAIRRNLLNAKGNAAQIQIQLTLLQDSVITPGRYKQALRQELKQQLDGWLDQIAM